MSAHASLNGPVGLGLGLISIGRTWGHGQEPPPPEAEARRLLEEALALGIRFLDTAPAYGASERILGAFLAGLGTRPDDLVVATKMGEHWDEAAGSGYADHGYDALRRSLDVSLARLGRIDLLQIHKATARALESDGVGRALEDARRAGVTAFGASVSDLEAAHAASRAGIYAWLQFPFNALDPRLQPIFGLAARDGTKILVNRPFGMGRIVHEGTGDPAAIRTRALRFVLQQGFSGRILTGTKSVEHLRENVRAFQEAVGPG
ncbi:aldo/keto reductase [Salinarimonas soli]|uniref:Aldo/keto reductase n=1 Tax=Salinarimonas soli TaxID=1638099 RepID=A0A5B2VAL7_9HYPH|nr:aldo/keto reductase [Salinarimonas soli]KAA2236034.1 aldo/keto reductase [Salinarimonas soli]